jgi:hypothetical protein
MFLTTSSKNTVIADSPIISNGTLQNSIYERLANGEEVSQKDTLKAMAELYSSGFPTLIPILSALSWEGKPFSIKRHFPMEPFYKLNIPKKSVWKCARQVSKSVSLSANGVLRSAITPALKTLYITPRYEQVRRLSSNYVNPFIKGALIKSLLTDSDCTKAVLQRSFVNLSSMFFSFAFLDVDRIRGIACDWLNYDEVQDMDYDFIPIIHECMSASKYSIATYSGTPKTLDNSIEVLWQDSSKAEWVTPCRSCGHWNMAAAQADLLKMIGRETIICAKCQKPINPEDGHWYHTDPDKTNFHGFHVPQVIMPMHYADPIKWGELLDKRDGKGNVSEQSFLNEILGESADSGIKLVTITDIKKASVLGPNELEQALDRFRSCKVRVLGVDWGGGGADQVSYTSAALVGLNVRTGKCECHYAVRFHAGYSHDHEAKMILELFLKGNCHFFAHDFGGAGSVRETLMIQAGLPIERIIGFSYIRGSSGRDIVRYNSPSHGEIRGYHTLDKARSLVLQAVCLKSGIILLPDYETSKNVTSDLLALMEDKHEIAGGSDVFLIRRQPKLSDDFAHALNYGCVAIWHSEEQYPDLSSVQGMKLTDQQISQISPDSGFLSNS